MIMYCREAGIEPSMPECDQAAGIIMALFSNGIGTAEELKAALQFRLESELRRYGQRLSRLAENRTRS